MSLYQDFGTYQEYAGIRGSQPFLLCGLYVCPFLGVHIHRQGHFWDQPDPDDGFAGDFP